MADDIELYVAPSSGATEADWARALFGKDGYQQRVNPTCGRVMTEVRVERWVLAALEFHTPITQRDTAVPRANHLAQLGSVDWISMER